MTPYWLRRVATLEPGDPHDLNPILDRRPPRGSSVRLAAVLVLFGGSADPDPLARGGLPADADVLLTQRAPTLRQHSGQVAFPGGAADPEDDAVRTAGNFHSAVGVRRHTGGRVLGAPEPDRRRRSG